MLTRRSCRALVVLCVVSLSALGDGKPGEFVSRREDGGIRVELRVRNDAGTATPLREEDRVGVDVAITDANGAAMPGLVPAAWMSIRAAGDQRPPADRCRQNVATFVTGSLFTRPEIDLNTYHVLAMNHDATINVVDPRFGFGGTQLLNVVELPAPAEDWALDQERNRLYVTIPKSGELAVVDATTWKIANAIAVGANARRLVLQQDGTAWVARDGGLTVVRNGAVAARIPTADAVRDLALGPDGASLLVAAGAKAMLVSTRTLKPLATIAADAPLVSADASSRAGLAYFAAESGTVYAVDAKRGRVVRTIRATPGPVQIRFEPSGRLAFVVNKNKRIVEIIDSAVNKVIQTADVDKDPDRIFFSRRLAYVRHLGSDIVLTIPLDRIGTAGEPVPIIDVPAGQESFGAGVPPAVADGVVAAGAEDAVLIAHPADKQIYYYREGMAAPMGQFSNYGQAPRAVLVVDRSLRERETGRFHTTAQLGGAGLYDVAVFVDAPRVVTCFEMQVAENETIRAEREKPLRVVPMIADTVVKAGQPVTLRFRLTDQADAPKPGLQDVEAVVMSSGTWHTREAAVSVGNGVYEIEVRPPVEGVYSVFVECASHGLALQKGELVVLYAKSS